MSTFFDWSQLPVVGIIFDIFGAAVLAWSFMAKDADAIASEIPFHGMTFGLPRLAWSLVRQRAEAFVGMTLLVTGFALQAAAYFAPNGTRLGGWREVMGTVALATIPAVATFLGMRVFAPSNAMQTWARADALEMTGAPRTTADQLILCVKCGKRLVDRHEWVRKTSDETKRKRDFLVKYWSCLSCGRRYELQEALELYKTQQEARP